AIFGVGECRGLKVKGNTFISDEELSGETLTSGYVLNANIVFTPGTSGTSTTGIPAGSMVPSLLQDATFQENRFTNMYEAASIIAQLGAIKIEGNMVQNCKTGFFLQALTSTTASGLIDEVLVNREQLALAQQLRNSLLNVMLNPTTQFLHTFTRGYPLPREFDLSQVIQV